MAIQYAGDLSASLLEAPVLRRSKDRQRRQWPSWWCRGWKVGEKSETEKGLVHRGKLCGRVKPVVTSSEHAAGEALHDWLGL